MEWAEFENLNPGFGKRRIKGTHLIPQRDWVTRGKYKTTFEARDFICKNAQKNKIFPAGSFQTS
jgi:hypothetical protein